jgi:hypothetical protein
MLILEFINLLNENIKIDTETAIRCSYLWLQFIICLQMVAKNHGTNLFKVCIINENRTS